MRRPPGWLERLIESGEYGRLAAQSDDENDLARRLSAVTGTDVSWTAVRCARLKLRERGVPCPTVYEARQPRGMLSEAQNEQIRTVFPTVDDAFDFEDEEPTQPGFQFSKDEMPSADGYEPPLPVIPDRHFVSSWPEALNDNWRARDEQPTSKRLTRDECPDGTLILWASDIHIPIHDDVACRLMVECAERSGVTRAILGGDGLDMNCLSKHAKESRRTVEHATILEEVEPGRWLLDWFATKETDYLLGNHEDRLKRFIDENPAFHGSLVSNFAQVTNLPAGINVLPQGGEVRLGSLSARHLDAEFKNGSGGKYPAQRVLEMLPSQSTIGGHVHRITMACRTTRDEDGINRTHKAWTMGHMSHEHMHYNYVSVAPNWQEGFGMIRVTWEDDRPRFSVTQIEILRDKNNRPYFEFGGDWYR